MAVSTVRELSTFALMAAGLAGLFAVQRRRAASPCSVAAAVVVGGTFHQ